MTLILGVMISGRGSNLGAILQEISKSRCPASVALVVSNIPGAPGLKIAEKYGVRHIVLEPSDFETRRAYEKQLARIFRSLKVELLVLAGYMRLVGSALLEEYPNKIINIHPSLLPDFKG
ncbi:phosphoribosylglycinamide formyltransferase, partial [bacterium]|nr:phosphoribosylglycinamide formyltransferase [bacterium]